MIVTEEPAVHDVYAVIEEVWSTFLGDGAPIFPGAHPVPADAWYAAITVTGEWEAMMLIAMPKALADRIATTMLGLPAEDPVALEDVTDALGELVNIVGGNVKSLMPGPSTLSLPLVAQGAVTTTSDLTEVCAVDLSWHGEPVQVSISVPTASLTHGSPS